MYSKIIKHSKIRINKDAKHTMLVRVSRGKVTTRFMSKKKEKVQQYADKSMLYADYT